MSGLVECSLYGCIADVTSIERRMADMGAVREEQKECHTLYAPSPSEGEHGREHEHEYEHGFPPPNYPPATPRTSSLLHLVTTSGGCVRIVSYRAGDFGTEERTNVMNVTECALLGTGSSASLESLLSSLDYSYVTWLGGGTTLRPVLCPNALVPL